MDLLDSISELYRASPLQILTDMAGPNHNEIVRLFPIKFAGIVHILLPTVTTTDYLFKAKPKIIPEWVCKYKVLY